MLAKMLKAGLMLSFLLLRRVSCFSEGIRLKDFCRNMEIQHGFGQEGDEPKPFTISPDSRELKEGEVIEVTLTSTTPFLGYMMDGRNEAGDPVGSFVSLGDPSMNQLLNCGNEKNSTMTHINNQEKTHVWGQWRAPTSGHFTFSAAVVDLHRYWKRPHTAPASTTTMPTTSSPTTALPTTSSPTTALPTTSSPTTALPMTSSPTTALPTTSSPTTALPMTSSPTTTIPTTSSPTSNPRTSLTTPKTDMTPAPEPAYELYQIRKVALLISHFFHLEAADFLLGFNTDLISPLAFKSLSLVSLFGAMVAFVFHFLYCQPFLIALTCMVVTLNLAQTTIAFFVCGPCHELRDTIMWVLRFLAILQAGCTVAAIFIFLTSEHYGCKAVTYGMISFTVWSVGNCVLRALLTNTDWAKSKRHSHKCRVSPSSSILPPPPVSSCTKCASVRKKRIIYCLTHWPYHTPANLTCTILLIVGIYL